MPVDKGAYVLKEDIPGDQAVLPGSTAEIAGVKEKDIIVRAQGKEITSETTLEDMLDACNVGDVLELGIKRDDAELTIKVPLEDRAKFI